MQNIVSRDYYKHIQPHTHAPAHMSISLYQNLIYTQPKTGRKQRLQMDEDSSTEQKTLRV